MMKSMRIAVLTALVAMGLAGVTLATEANAQTTGPVPYNETVIIADSASHVVGPTGGRLTISSLTMTNFSTSTQQLRIFNPSTPNGDCSGTPTGGSYPDYVVLLQARSTQELTFPVGVGYPKLNGASCIAFQVGTVLNGGSVQVFLVGTH